MLAGLADSERFCYFLITFVTQNSIQIEFTIAKEDLMGEPKVGRRFKGILWLQGEVDCL